MNETGSICGLWIDPEGNARICLADSAGERTSTSAVFQPFLWTNSEADFFNYKCLAESLKSPGVPPTPLNRLLSFPTISDMEDYFKKRDKRLPVERLSVPENYHKHDLRQGHDKPVHLL